MNSLPIGTCRFCLFEGEAIFRQLPCLSPELADLKAQGLATLNALGIPRKQP